MTSRSRFVLLCAAVLVGVTLAGCGSRWLAGGKLHFDQRRYEQALENFELAVAEQPENGEAHLWRGRALASPGIERDEEAVAAITRARELAPELQEMIDNSLISFWSVRYNSGLSFAKSADEARQAGDEEQARERLESAIDRFERAMLFCPDSVQNYSNLGRVYFQLGRRDEGLEMFERARQLGGDRPELQDFIFRVFRSLGIQEMEKDTAEGYRAAIGYFEQAATFDRPDEDLATIRFNLGLACARLADLVGPGEEKDSLLQRAAENYNTVLGYDAQDTAALENLTYVYLDLADADKALESCQRLIDIEPWSPAYNVLMMRVQRDAGNKEKSGAYLMLYEVFGTGTPEPGNRDAIMRLLSSYGPGSDMQKRLRDRGVPEQVYTYEGPQGSSYVWLYWSAGRVYIFYQGREQFHGSFEPVNPEKVQELLGG